MFGTDIALKHQVALYRHQELIAEAMRQHEIEQAFGQNRLHRVDRVFAARSALATALLRAANWLMPEDRHGHPAAGGLELRPGR